MILVLLDKKQSVALLSGGRRGEGEGGVAHQAHHGLRRVELLSHERLRTRRCRRTTATVAVLVLVVRAGGGVGVAAGAVAATSVAAAAPAAAISVRGRGALAISAVSSAAVSTVAAAAAPAVLGTAAAAAAARRAHPPVALVLVHQVGIVGVVAAAETGTTAWKRRGYGNMRDVFLMLYFTSDTI